MWKNNLQKILVMLSIKALESALKAIGCEHDYDD